MPDFQYEKSVVRSYHFAQDSAKAGEMATVEQRFAHDAYVWRGYHPFGEIQDPKEVGTTFWQSLMTSLTHLKRREDIFFAGQNWLKEDGSVWVVSMGHLMGLFDRPWLCIAPTHKIAMLRYCAFYRVKDGKIAEVSMYFDLPHLMRQAGQVLFPNQTAAHLIQPGPLTHGGLLFDPQPAEAGLQTQAAIDAMITDLGQWALGLPLEEELARTWHDDMLWWGPEGIGSSYTIERYAKQHSAPFRAAFSDRSATNHIARVAEGHFGAFVGWPNFTARLSGEFMGQKPTGAFGEFRVIDVYRREGSKLAENWVFIDLVHFWKTQGWDVLGGIVK